eukprot:COSAG04_NODE_519_length_13169_cov_10.968248_11_plen_213_part_00
MSVVALPAANLTAVAARPVFQELVVSFRERLWPCSERGPILYATDKQTSSPKHCVAHHTNNIAQRPSSTGCEHSAPRMTPQSRQSVSPTIANRHGDAAASQGRCSSSSEWPSQQSSKPWQATRTQAQLVAPPRRKRAAYETLELVLARRQRDGVHLHVAPRVAAGKLRAIGALGKATRMIQAPLLPQDACGSRYMRRGRSRREGGRCTSLAC